MRSRSQKLLVRLSAIITTNSVFTPSKITGSISLHPEGSGGPLDTLPELTPVATYAESLSSDQAPNPASSPAFELPHRAPALAVRLVPSLG
jgi:hypothetical protein